MQIRNLLYEYRVLRSVRFNIPVISVGNLSMGGTGKSPHIEYLIQTLSPYIKPAVLSRGYGRKTKGFRQVTVKSSVIDAGDEAVQFKRKYRHIPVGVAENRILGIPSLLSTNSDTQLILLDDAFQHRGVTPFINLLLTEYEHPFFEDYIVPMGRLREGRNSAQRADAIIVTKSPADYSKLNLKKYKDELKRYNTPLFFSYMEYGVPYNAMDPADKIFQLSSHSVILLTGIAKSQYLYDHLKPKVNFIHHYDYPDHYKFNPHEIAQAITALRELSDPRILITTEKDAARIEPHLQYLIKENVKVYLLPIRVKFHEGDKFSDWIKNKLLEFKS